MILRVVRRVVLVILGSLLGAFLGVPLEGRALAADLCGAAAPMVLADATPATRARTLKEARRTAILGDHAKARSMYLALLVRRAEDDEAIAGLARIDTWDGCLDLAEKGYRTVLSRHPGDADARAGLVDILLRQRRWDEAEVELDRGIARSPRSPELLARRSRLAHYRGEEGRAIEDATLALALDPLDPTLRAQRETMFLGEARLGLRGQFFPKGYDDVYTADTEVMQRWRRYRFHLGHQLVTRTGAFGQTTVIDGRRALGAYVHAPNGGWAGVEAAFTSPAVALPRWAVTLSASTPVSTRFTVHAAAGVWSYATDKTVYLISPSVGLALSEHFEVGLRWWVSSVVASVGAAVVSDTVHSVGIRGVWRPEPAVLVGAEYTYGVQLDQNPTLAQFLELRSHIVTAFARRMITPEIGIAPVVTLERRENVRTGDILFVPALEASVLVRW